MDAYARFGVPEAWIVMPWPHCVEVYILAAGSYRRYGAFLETDTLTSEAAHRINYAPRLSPPSIEQRREVSG